MSPARPDPSDAVRGARSPHPAAGAFDAASEAPPRLADPAVLALLFLVLALQLVAWNALQGYQVADSVEFMERARTLVRGESMVDSTSIRPIGFSALLLPFFLVADALGLPDQRVVVGCTYLLQIVLGLSLVYRVVRVGARLGGRTTGLVAGLFVGANPLFLQYSAQAESGIAAALCVALGIERFLDRGSKRDHAIGGLWLGASFLVAYKSIVVVLAIVLVLFARDRWRRRDAWIAALRGLGVAMLVQVVIDWMMYGRPGASLLTYLVTNFGGVLASFFHRLHLTAIAEPIYRFNLRFQGLDYDMPANVGDIGVRGLQSRWWYLEHLPQMLVWPVLACAAIGLARSVFKASWKSTLLLVCIAAFLAASSNKGSKDYRLWIPLLPFLAPICASGFTSALSFVRSRAWRRTFGFAVLAPSVALGLATFLGLNTHHFSGYWRAMEFANDLADERYSVNIARARTWGPEHPPERVRVGAAYNWAVYLRESPEVELVKLPHQLNSWIQYGELEKGHDFAALEELDVFLVHQPILQTNLDLMEWVSAHFEVAGLLFDRATHEDLGPIYVLVRRTGRADAATFSDTSLDSVRPQGDDRATPSGAEFVGRAADGSVERAVLLDFAVRTLPPDDFGWITYRWWTPSGITRDLTIVDRLTSPDERNTWQNDHRGAWGMRPTNTWRAGEVISEGYPLVPATSPFDPNLPWRPIGGAYRRGDLLPLRLWMALRELEPDSHAVLATFERARPGADVPLEPGDPNTPSIDGPEFSADGLVQVGAFFLPVHPLARLPDDGRPVPN